MKPTSSFVYCPDCGSMTQPSLSNIHVCNEYKKRVGQNISSYITKHWDPTLRCWKVDTSKDKKEGYSTCEIGPRHKMLGPGDPGKSSGSTTGSVVNSSGYQFVQVYPFDGVDIKKWPNTYKYLLKFHFHRDEDRGKYIPSEDYKDRILKGVYKPEPKYGYGGSMHWGNAYTEAWNQEYD